MAKTKQRTKGGFKFAELVSNIDGKPTDSITHNLVKNVLKAQAMSK